MGGGGAYVKRGNLLVKVKFHGRPICHLFPPRLSQPTAALTTVTRVKTTASGPPVCPLLAGAVRNLLCREIPLATPGDQQCDPAVWGLDRKQQMQKATGRLKEGR